MQRKFHARSCVRFEILRYIATHHFWRKKLFRLLQEGAEHKALDKLWKNLFVCCASFCPKSKPFHQTSPHSLKALVCAGLYRSHTDSVQPCCGLSQWVWTPGIQRWIKSPGSNQRITLMAAAIMAVVVVGHDGGKRHFYL